MPIRKRGTNLTKKLTKLYTVTSVTNSKTTTSVSVQKPHRSHRQARWNHSCFGLWCVWLSDCDISHLRFFHLAPGLPVIQIQCTKTGATNNFTFHLCLTGKFSTVNINLAGWYTGLSLKQKKHFKQNYNQDFDKLYLKLKFQSMKNAKHYKN